MTIAVDGLTESIDAFKNKTTKDPKVKALVEINDSGMVQVKEVTVTYNLDNSTSITDSLFSFFGKKVESVDKSDTEESPASEQQGLKKVYKF